MKSKFNLGGCQKAQCDATMRDRSALEDPSRGNGIDLQFERSSPVSSLSWVSGFSMGKTSAKRIGKPSFTPSLVSNITPNLAGQNESAVKNLRLGLFLPTLISFVLRFLLRRSSPSKGSIVIYIATFLPAFFLTNYLIKIGQPRRDPGTGTLISYGEDLNQPGVTEWCFDIIYVTCQ